MRRSIEFFCLAALFLFASLPGCQRSTPPPATYPVHGTIRVNGKPPGAGVVEFRSVADPAVAALGEIQPDDSFSLWITHEGKRIEGAPAGEYRVTILFTSREEKDKRSPITLAKTRTVTAGDNTLTLEAASP